jgi:nucleoside-diphosphate-sugar epimerase
VTVLVTGAGGFIGGHLVRALLDRGEQVRAADIRPLGDWQQLHPAAVNLRLDLAVPGAARFAAAGAGTVYHLAAQAGGMGYISTHQADCTLSVLADAAVIRAAAGAPARLWYASSACVYPLHLQQAADAPDLAEHMAHPADPEQGYGWEKLFGEQMCLAFAADAGLQARIGRYQSVFGPHAAWRGGREKAPTAICRKVALAKLAGERIIGIWGDGTAIRTFTYVSDAVDATLAITACDYGGPLNVGTSETMSVLELVDAVCEIAGWQLSYVRHTDGPVGVPGRRGCDTRLTAEKAGWKAQVSVRDGLERTYAWVQDQIRAGRG